MPATVASLKGDLNISFNEVPNVLDVTVPREEESIVREVVLNNETVSVIEFNGLSGIGKTVLLHRIADTHFNWDPTLESATKPTLTTLVDLQSYSQGNVEVRMRVIAAEVIRQLNLQLTEEQQLDPDTFLSSSNLIALLNQYVPIFIFDNSNFANDSLELELQRWINQQIKLVGKAKKSVFVFAGVAPIKWESFALRRHLLQIEMLPFSEMQVGEQLVKEFGDVTEEEIQLVAYYGAGLPGISAKILTILRKAGGTNQEFAERFHNELILPMFKEVPENIKEKVFQIAALRKFTLFEIARIYKSLGVNTAGIGKILVSTGYVRYSLLLHAYVMDPTVRRMVNRNQRLRDPEEFSVAHLAMTDLHRESIVSTMSSTYITEAIYHSIQASRVLEHPQDELRNQVNSIVQIVKKGLHKNYSLEGVVEYYLRQTLDIVRTQVLADSEVLELLGPEELNLLLEALKIE